MALPNKKVIFLFLTFFTSVFYAQELEENLIIGKVFSKDSVEVSNIHILNLTQKKATITNKKGLFSIHAKIGDTLLLSSIQFKKKIVIDTLIINQKITKILIAENSIELKEVIVTPNNLSGYLINDMGNLNLPKLPTAANSGIPNAHVKRKTQNERKFYTARTWDFRLTSVKLDPIINAISGRTARMKRRVKQEKKDSEYQSYYLALGDSLVVKELQIPKYRIYDFYFFCEEDPSFDSITKIKSTWEVWKFLKYKSTEYRVLNNLER
ncbi:hypothetical protein [Spongiivirga citrea]|uniref:Carboxypeptidase-like regulatory domain-containing protein n=1 Tax=Spongiivirga citrea TaxID=1481457 RepID=A0A6M0CJV7_9FLAO|nr:hypothetical protein [Spongiivirga citrea]NER18226.1 hypothetical protein [Spongiivirga citrea]